MLNKKIIGLFVLGLALSSPLQSANAMPSPGATSCYEPSICKRGYNSKGNAMGEKNIGSGDCWCVYDINNSFFTMHMEDDEWVSGHSEDTNGCVIPGECIANSKSLCETQNKYSTCKAVNELTGSNTECWRPNGCKTGYTQIAGQCGSDVNNYDMDDFGCGKCVLTCEEGSYISDATCRDAHPGWDCTPNDKGCYAPTGCSIGYEDNTWHLGSGEDRLGSGVCDCIFYEGKEECENRLGATCTLDKYGCPIPDVSTCDYRTGTDFKNDPNNRYSTYWNAYFDPNGNNLCVAFDMCDLNNGAKWKDDLTCENGTKDLDANGCGKCICNDGYKLENGTCVLDVITYGSITECETQNPGFVCDYYGGSYGDASKWVSTGTCKANYKLENGACIPQTCEEGTYPSKEECEEKYPGFECGEVGDDSSLGSGPQGHSEGGN